MNSEELKEVLKKERGISIDVIGDNDTFDFKCDQCGRCCTGGTIETILFKPYDIYKLSKGLNKNPIDIVNSYGDLYIGEGSGFPIVRLDGKLTFDFQEGPLMVCPFREELDDGRKICGVHNFKPGSCRLFPLGRVSAHNKETGKPEGVHYFLQEVNCGEKGEIHTIKDWIGDPKNEEEILIEESNIISGICDYINLPELRDLAIEYPQTRKSIEAIHSAIFGMYYVNYKLDEDFLTQFKYNGEKIKEMCKGFAYSLLRTLAEDTKVGKHVRSKVIAKDFEANNSEYIKKMDIEFAKVRGSK